MTTTERRSRSGTFRALTAADTAAGARKPRSCSSERTKRALTHPRTRTAAALVLLGVVVWRLGAGPFLDGLRAVDLPAIAAALAIGAATTVCGAWRWALVSRRLGMPMRLRPAVADCYQALFLNTVLPAGVLGDVGRAVAHGRATGDVGRSARAVVIEKSAGQIVLVLVGVAVLAVEPAVLQVLHIPWALVLGAAGLAVGLVLAVRRVRLALGTLLRDAVRGTSPAVLGLSLLALVGYLGLFLVAARAVGVSAPTVEVLPLLVLALFVMGLPVNVGGFGPREATAALAFGAVGLGAAQGLSTAVVYGVLTLVSTLPGALVLLRRRIGLPGRAQVALASSTMTSPAPSSVT